MGRPKKKKVTKAMREWSRGYYCAVAKMIEMEGLVEPSAQELFHSGGGAEDADPQDQEIFKKHGLMPAN